MDEKRQNEAGIADENQALKLKPDDWAASYARGQLYIATGNWAGAVDDYNRVIEANPTAEQGQIMVQSYLMRGKAREQLGQKAGAEADIKKATELDPTLAGPVDSSTAKK